MSLGSGTEFAGLIAQSLRPETFTLIDFGCSGGISSMWRVFGDRLRAFGFDPNIAECRRLQAAETLPHVEYLAAFVGTPGLPVTVDERARLPWSRIPAHRLSYSRTHEIRAKAIENASAREKTRLNAWQKTELADSATSLHPLQFFQERRLTQVDFIKIDVDGTDFELLQLLGSELAALGVLGITIEVPFFGSDAAEDHTFHNVDRFMKAHKFELFNLTMRRYSTKYLPGRYTIEMPAETEYGRVYQGDALYLLDLGQDDWVKDAEAKSAEVLLKLAALFSMFDLPDCAAELLVKFRNRISSLIDPEKGLDLLTKQVQERQGRSPDKSYAEYIAAFEADDPFFYMKDAKQVEVCHDPQGKIEQLRARAPAPDVAAFSASQRVIHDGAACTGSNPLVILTPGALWAYAVELSLDRRVAKPNWRLHILLDVVVEEGVLGVGVLTADGTEFQVQTSVSEIDERVSLHLTTSALRCTGSLMFRNHSDSGPTRAKVELLAVIPDDSEQV